MPATYNNSISNTTFSQTATSNKAYTNTPDWNLHLQHLGAHLPTFWEYQNYCLYAHAEWHFWCIQMSNGRVLHSLIDLQLTIKSSGMVRFVTQFRRSYWWQCLHLKGQEGLEKSLGFLALPGLTEPEDGSTAFLRNTKKQPNEQRNIQEWLKRQ